MIGCKRGRGRGVHYARATWGDHRMLVRGRVWLDLVRDAGGEACVESAEGVCELCVDLIDTYVEYGMESCKKP